MIDYPAHRHWPKEDILQYRLVCDEVKNGKVFRREEFSTAVEGDQQFRGDASADLVSA